MKKILPEAKEEKKLVTIVLTFDGEPKEQKNYRNRMLFVLHLFTVSQHQTYV